MSDYLRRIVARSMPSSEASAFASPSPFGPSFSLLETTGAEESAAGADFEEIDQEIVAAPRRTPAASPRDAAPSRVPMGETVAPRPIVSPDRDSALARSIAPEPARTVAPRRPIEPPPLRAPHTTDPASFETSASPTPPLMPPPNVPAENATADERMNPPSEPRLPLEPPASREAPTSWSTQPSIDVPRSTDREAKIRPAPAIAHEVFAPPLPPASKAAPAIADALARVDRLLLPREPAPPSIAPPPSEGSRVSIGTIRVEVVHPARPSPTLPMAPAPRRMPPRAPRLGAPASKLRFGLGQG